MTATTKPPALCARCPECGTNDVPVRNGTYAAHRRYVPTVMTRSSRTERCPGSLRAATPAAIAQWVAWETSGAKNAAAFHAGKLAEARAVLARAEADDAAARARLDAITRIAAELAALNTATETTT